MKLFEPVQVQAGGTVWGADLRSSVRGFVKVGVVAEILHTLCTQLYYNPTILKFLDPPLLHLPITISALSPNNQANLRRKYLEDLRTLSQLFNDGVLSDSEFQEMFSMDFKSSSSWNKQQDLPLIHDSLFAWTLKLTFLIMCVA